MKKIGSRFSLVAVQNGNGIATVTTYFIATTMSQGVTRTNPASGWVANVFQPPTADKPYAWKYTKTTYTQSGTEPTYTPCELITVWQTGANINLLECAGFDCEEAMHAWTSRGNRFAPTYSGYTSLATATNGKIVSSDDDEVPVINTASTVGTAGNEWPEKIPEGYHLWTSQTHYFGKNGQGTKAVAVQRQYCLSSSATTLSDATAWSSVRQSPTAAKPYVWMRDYVASATHTINIGYDASANIFLAYQRPSAYGGFDGIGKISDGTQGRNSFMNTIDLPSSNTGGKNMLMQMLWYASGNRSNVLEEGTWYTLSFWCKGHVMSTNGNTESGAASSRSATFKTFIYGSNSYPAIDTSAGVYADGVLDASPALDAGHVWTATTNWTRHTFTFKTAASLSNVDKKLLFRLLPSDAAVFRNYVFICMPKLEVGLMATAFMDNGQDLVNASLRVTPWVENMQFYSGRRGEPYVDIVVFTDGKQYACTETHISSAANKPTSGGDNQWWRMGDQRQFIATMLFLADKALINNLIATLIQTGYTGQPHIEAEGSEFKVFGSGQYPAIYLAVNNDGKAVLRFQNEDTGEFLYDLGPDGIMRDFTEVADTHTTQALKKLVNATRVSEILDISDSDCTTYYRFNEGYKQIGSGNNRTKEYHVSGTNLPSAKNAQYFTSQISAANNYVGTTIDDGWYVRPNNGHYIAKKSGRYQQDGGINQEVAIYMVYIYRFTGGKLISSIPVYFIYTDNQNASHSVGCDLDGNELDTSTYQYLYSYSGLAG